MSTPQPLSYQVQLTDVSLQVTEWPGSGDPVLLLHATGFHSRCWDQIVRQLPGVHIYAVDLRYHGGSDSHGECHWPLMAGDIEQLLDRLDLQRVVGVGHSLGGYLVAYAAATRLARFRQLVLIDPVITPRELYTKHSDAGESPDPAANPVSRRKNQWRDANEMYERFRSREPFAGWQAQVLRDYCEYALVEAPGESTYQLACDPLHEAAVYVSRRESEIIYELLPGLSLPVTLLRARHDPQPRHDFSTSPTWPGLAGMLPNAREIYLPDMTHFIPMEDPILVARIIREALEDTWTGGA